MSDPTKMSEEERGREALREQAEEIARLDRILAQQYGQDAQSVAEIEKPAPRERLFSRKVMFGWAFGALIVVFVVRMVLPVVFETVKESVVRSIKESTGNTAITPVVAPTPPTPTAVIEAPGTPAPGTPAPGTPAPAATSAKPAAPNSKVQIKKITH